MQLTEKTAVVTSIDGDFVLLKSNDNDSCGSCSANSSCGSVKLLNRTAAGFRIHNSLGLKKGDAVVIALATEKLLLGTVLVYLIPLLFLFLFAIVGKLLSGEMLSISMGVGGFFLSLLFVRNYLKQSNTTNNFEPTIIRKVIQIKQSSLVL